MLILLDALASYSHIVLHVSALTYLARAVLIAPISGITMALVARRGWPVVVFLSDHVLLSKRQWWFIDRFNGLGSHVFPWVTQQTLEFEMTALAAQIHVPVLATDSQRLAGSLPATVLAGTRQVGLLERPPNIPEVESGRQNIPFHQASSKISPSRVK
jgi:hypothetical protein